MLTYPLHERYNKNAEDMSQMNNERRFIKMATIRKRGDSYQIRVSCGYGMNGKQVIRTKSWKPDTKMTAKQIEKELNKQAVLFEEACMNGFMTSATKFSEFAERWKQEYAKNNLKQTTIDNMSHTINRINEEIGHFRLDKINTRIIQNLIVSLSEGDEKKGYKPLCAKTVKNYISYVSSVFDYAIRLEMLIRNPCRNANIPTVKRTERDMYSIDEAQTFIDTLIKSAPLMYQCYFILAIYSGFRRGELSGLTWDNIDFKNHVITIEKALYHIKDKGNVLDAPKTTASYRSLKLPEIIFTYLKRLQDFYESESVRLGTKWEENNFVFKRSEGQVLSPSAPSKWLCKFCDREGLRHVTPHSFRHLAASLMIDAGASVKTVQACLGHSDASTTLNIYAHAFAKSQAKISEAVGNNFKLA